MRKAYITSGPRGAGKSTFVLKLKEYNPDLVVFHRDKAFNEEFGNSWTDPYSGIALILKDFVKYKITDMIYSSDEDATIVIDSWNGSYQERKFLVDVLIYAGVSCVNCLYFVTPLPICLKWFSYKPDASHWMEIGVIRDYKLYHEKADDIRNPQDELRFLFDGALFDNTYWINPAQLVLPGINFNL